MTQDASSSPENSPQVSAKTPSERRDSPRLAPTESRLWVGWPKDGEFFVAGASLANISQSGALVVVEAAPSQGQTIWIRLEGPAPIDDVQATVVEVHEKPGPVNEYEVHLAFREPFPQAFYLAAVDGLPTLRQRGPR